MDPHSQLIQEHQHLREKASALQEAVIQASPSVESVLLDFQRLIRSHFDREESYYRIVDNDKRFPDRALVHQLRNDHAATIFALESLLIRLRKSGITPDWRARLGSLMSVFLPHMDQEERQLFPAGRTLLTPQEIESLAKAMHP